MKRKPGESFEDYKIRRRTSQDNTKAKLKGRLFWRAGATGVTKDGRRVTLGNYRNPKND